MDKITGRLLVVDDEDVILDLFKTLFRDDGYELNFAETGQDAIRILRERPIDLVITDKNLPDLNGLDVLRVAKEVNPLIEVIIVTGYASLDTVLAAFELDAYDYLLKPLHNIFDITRKVRQALEKQRMVIENQRLLTHLQEHARKLEEALQERKRAEAELIQSEKLAGIGTLASGVAHEVSSPLFGILGLAEAIIDEDDPSLMKQYAREIVDYSKQIRDVVQELSAYSRVSSREEVSPVDIRRVVEDAVKLVLRSKPEPRPSLQLELEPSVNLRARANEIQQLLVNLIKNALDASEPSATSAPASVPTVHIRAWQDGTTTILQVSDTGKGIPAAHLEKIFEPFFTTKDVGRGTGLGLHIVYRIVQKYMGSINVESKEGSGTTFTMRFPLREA